MRDGDRGGGDWCDYHMTGDIITDMALVGVVCFATGFAFAWAMVRWC